MLKSILKFLFPKTIASIENEAIDNHWFDIEQANIISQYGSLANYQEHLRDMEALHQAMYEQEMRERWQEPDVNYFIEEENER
jgi:phage terminase large subunit-like protein